MASLHQLPENLLGSFAFYSGVVLTKTLLMSALTAFKRIRHKIFANPEDASLVKKPVELNNEIVERVRRNHLNDLENVLPFVLIGAIYLFTNPCATTALWQFRIFAISRIVHTVAYQLALPTVFRAAPFLIGMAVNISMLVKILASFSQFA